MMKKKPLSSLTIVLVAATLVAAACSKPPKGVTAKGGANNSGGVNTPVAPGENASGATATTGPGGTLPGGAQVHGPGGPAASVVVGTGPSTAGGTTNALGGAADTSQAYNVGKRIYPVSSQRRLPYSTGVGENTINLDFSYDATNCGVNVVNAITAAGGTLPAPTQYYRAAPTSTDTVNAEIKESADLMVRYWNDHAFDAAFYLPHIRPLMGQDPKNQFFGRHLTYKMIDGGSNQCPDKTSAAATQAAQQDHAFVVFNNLEGASPVGAYNMAADLNTQPANIRPMHFGTLWLSDQDYSRFAPYSWTQFASGTTITKEWASYVCARLVGKDAIDSPDASLKKTKRVFGFVHTNAVEDVRLANEFKGYLKNSCGGTSPIKTEVTYDGTDFSKAQQDDANLIAQLKLSGVTSVLMLTEPVQPLFQLDEAKSQNYYPEWIWSSFGYSDSNTVQRLYDQSETAGSFGVSTLGDFGGFGFGAGDPFLMYHTYHQTAPDGKACDPSSKPGMEHGDGGNGNISRYCKAPTALVTWYYTMLPLIGGMLFAGPDVSAANISKGLQAYPTTHYSGGGPTTDARAALVGAGPGKYNFLVDSVEWRWRPEFTSPPPETYKKNGAAGGWVEYPDCARHYIDWGSPTYSPGWEPGSADYAAWCGNAKYDPNATDTNKTDYPRWLRTDGSWNGK